MKIWEIIKDCANGSYIEGDAFINELGQEIYFDGHSIKGLEDLNPKSTWQHATLIEREVS
ncbi:hypothetical protein LYSBPC_13600 [Lysinibacillus piscis]|uniref:YopX protein domain-containing protein n=2 Tax=Lysinibacillus piscis TaxID=2518931 RepID=A0ABQ5NJE3_9BACI|nr:hypothetical protein LYSBPC_13600 [Lysinibacillus sp. KH24]